MRTVQINTPSGRYEVKIGPGLLDTIGAEVRQSTKARRCAVIAGENCFPLYGRRVLRSLEAVGLEALPLVFPAGEQTKCLQRYEELLFFLADNRFTRTDCVIALGGGVTGDLSGFAAATYQRGIPYIQVPTTLLAAVDSSVGGKTAIDLPQGKNQVGAFYQPSLVLCDTDTLSTLPEREITAGYAEVIKYAILGDPVLFQTLKDRSGSLPDVIETCVKCKADIVAEDEHDVGRRRLLNLGHTFGHAVERASGFQLLHGEAVAIGTGMICRAAVKKGYLSSEDRDEILSLLHSYGLPTETDYSPAALQDALLLDKKFSGGKLHLVVPCGIGKCEIVPAGQEELPLWLEMGYE